MSEEKKSEYKKAICPNCNLPLNFATKQNIDYTLSKADNKVWCTHCQRYVKFSLKQG